MTRSAPVLAAAAAGALLLASAMPAAAQFGAVIPPPVRPAPVTVIDGDTVPVSPVDSAQAATRMDLRAWVDSAAQSLTLGADTAAAPMLAVAADPTVADTTVADTTVRVTAPLPLTPDQPDAPPSTDGSVSTGTTLRDGAPAPDTASALPLFGALGGAMTLAGLALRRRRR